MHALPVMKLSCLLSDSTAHVLDKLKYAYKYHCLINTCNRLVMDIATVHRNYYIILTEMYDLIFIHSFDWYHAKYAK